LGFIGRYIYCTGGEQFVSIGNFKTDAQTQIQLVKTVNNLPEVAYYFMDDVSLIDLDEVGIEEIGTNKLVVYPNPVGNQLNVSSNQFEVKTIEILDVLGRAQMVRQAYHDGSSVVGHADEGSISIDVSTLSNGIYFIRATDINGNVLNGKFVKE
jgi:hypothetical protein